MVELPDDHPQHAIIWTTVIRGGFPQSCLCNSAQFSQF